MSEIREALAALAASDPGLLRFGASHHRYVLAPPVVPPDKPIDYPEDLHAFAVQVGRSGAGPGHGFLGVTRDLVRADAGWRIGLAVSHLGCGYAAIVSFDPSSFGQVWIDARAIGVAKPIAPSFTAWYLDWIDRLAHDTPPEAHVPPGACPLPNAISGFLGVTERELGLAAGALAGPALRDALGELGPHSIEIAAESSVLHANGTRVDPCIACARLIENLAADGLRPDVVRPG